MKRINQQRRQERKFRIQSRKIDCKVTYNPWETVPGRSGEESWLVPSGPFDVQRPWQE